MQLVGIKVFVLIVFAVDYIQTELSPDGQNVCLKAETYEEKIETKVKKAKPYKKKKWCWNISKRFSCEVSDIKWELVTEYRTVNRTRLVPNCCDGYKEERERVTKCLPVCLKGCVNGKCAAPDYCACYPGYYGPECEKECDDGLWGRNCANKCSCSNNGKCHKIHGFCECEEGWTGSRCESPCQSGYYGLMCKKKCECGNNSCHHITGECFTTTASTTQPPPEVSAITDSHIRETSLETNQPGETVETFTEVSPGEISEMTETDPSEDMLAISKASEETQYATAETDDATEDTDVFENTEKTNKLMSFTDEMETTGTTREAEIKLIHVKESEGALETFTDNVKVTKESSDVDINSSINSTTQINFSGSELDMDTDNFINGQKGNKNTMLKIFHFLPGLSVFSSVSFLIFIIAAMWLINKHRSKTRKLLVSSEKKEKLPQIEDQIKYPEESFFWSSNCTNPVYLSDVDLNRTPTVLETFKPLSVDTIAKKEIR